MLNIERAIANTQLTLIYAKYQFEIELKIRIIYEYRLNSIYPAIHWLFQIAEQQLIECDWLSEWLNMELPDFTNWLTEELTKSCIWMFIKNPKNSNWLTNWLTVLGD